MGNYAIFLNVGKSYERQASKIFYNKCPKILDLKSSSGRTDIFQKLTLGAPDTMTYKTK